MTAPSVQVQSGGPMQLSYKNAALVRCPIAPRCDNASAMRDGYHWTEYGVAINLGNLAYWDDASG